MEGIVLASSMASSSKDESNPVYITVHFEDGPAQGLLTQLSEDDYCEPGYWKFEEEHKCLPGAKVLYTDGDSSFLREWPNALHGTFTDQDGDEHPYVREEQLPCLEIVACVDAAETTPQFRKAPGGYGHLIIERDIEEESERATKRHKRSRDEDWTPGKVAQKSRPLKLPVAKKQKPPSAPISRSGLCESQSQDPERTLIIGAKCMGESKEALINSGLVQPASLQRISEGSLNSLDADMDALVERSEGTHQPNSDAPHSMNSASKVDLASDKFMVPKEQLTNTALASEETCCNVEPNPNSTGSASIVERSTTKAPNSISSAAKETCCNAKPSSEEETCCNVEPNPNSTGSASIVERATTKAPNSISSAAKETCCNTKPSSDSMGESTTNGKGQIAPTTIALASGSETRAKSMDESLTIEEKATEPPPNDAASEDGKSSSNTVTQAAPGLSASKTGITIDHAKTNRAICRTCNQTIQHNTLRCGVEAYAGGRTTMQWAHADCFVQRIRAEYASARRGKCKGSGEAFVVGSLRVGFEVGATRSWWCIPEAAKWTKKLVDAGKRIESVLGIDALEPDHGVALLSSLNGEVDASSLHRTSAQAKQSAPRGKQQRHSKKPIVGSASSDDIEIHENRDSDNDIELIASLRQ